MRRLESSIECIVYTYFRPLSTNMNGCGVEAIENTQTFVYATERKKAMRSWSKAKKQIVVWSNKKPTSADEEAAEKCGDCVHYSLCVRARRVCLLFIHIITSNKRWQKQQQHPVATGAHSQHTIDIASERSKCEPRDSSKIVFSQRHFIFFLLLLFTFIRLLANDDCRMMPKAAVALLRLPQIAWVVMCMAWLKKKYIWPPCGNSKPERI